MDKTYELLNDIRKCPEMYLGRKSLELLHAYLAGYYHFRGHDEPDCLTGFQEYVAEFYKMRTSHSWSDFIRFFSSSDEEAFLKFYTLFDEFIEKQEMNKVHQILKIEYDDAVNEYLSLLDYCGKHSNSFTMITQIKNPFSEAPLNLKHDQLLKPIEPYLIEQVISGGQRAETMTDSLHNAINRYKSCKETRRFLTETPNMLLSLQNGLPEDICFYRNDDLWLISTSHDQAISLINFTIKDRDFLNKHNIRYSELDITYLQKLKIIMNAERP